MAGPGVRYPGIDKMRGGARHIYRFTFGQRDAAIRNGTDTSRGAGPLACGARPSRGFGGKAPGCALHLCGTDFRALPGRGRCRCDPQRAVGAARATTPKPASCGADQYTAAGKSKPQLPLPATAPSAVRRLCSRP